MNEKVQRHENNRRRRGARGARVFILVVATCSVTSFAAFLRSAAQDAADYGLWFVASSALAALLLTTVLLLALFAHIRRTSERRGAELLSQMPGAEVLGRVVYAADTEHVVRQLGGTPSSNPGTEQFVAAVDAHELRIVRGKTGAQVLSVPSSDLQGVSTRNSEMLAGGPKITMVFSVRDGQRGTLELPLYLVFSDGVFARGLSAEELARRVARTNEVAGLSHVD